MAIYWQGRGYYKRSKHFVGSSENGMSIDGHEWNKVNGYESDAHKVTKKIELEKIERRYHRS